MAEIVITTFTDPMMGLTYECEPIYEKLKERYGEKIEFRYVMAGLGRDVSDFMTAEELSYKPEEGIRRYCKRLAQIYKSEEVVGGLPINMEGFHLFDAEHRSSYPLNIAYEATKLTCYERAEKFLYNLRHATVLDARQTTRFDVIYDVAEETGIDMSHFKKSLEDGSAEEEFKKDLEYTKSLGIYSLPSYLIKVNGKEMLVKSLIGFKDFCRIIET